MKGPVQNFLLVNPRRHIPDESCRIQQTIYWESNNKDQDNTQNLIRVNNYCPIFKRDVFPTEKSIYLSRNLKNDNCHIFLLYVF